jgi:hypothetical protein
MAAVIGQTLDGTSTVTAKIVQDRENLYAVEQGIKGIKTLLGGLKTPVPTGLKNLGLNIDGAELITCGAGFLTFFKYACTTRYPQDVPVKLIKSADGNVVRSREDLQKRNNKIGKTALAYEMVHKPQKALASLGFLVVSFTSFVRMLEAFAIPVLSSIEKGIGMIPMIGPTIGAGIAKNFYPVGGIALVAAHGALVFDSIRYLYLAGSDGSKSIAKGLIQLVSRVAALALDLFFVLHVSNPIVMGCAGIGMATLAIVSCVYKWYRSSQKEHQQKELLELFKYQEKEKQLAKSRHNDKLEPQGI